MLNFLFYLSEGVCTQTTVNLLCEKVAIKDERNEEFLFCFAQNKFIQGQLGCVLLTFLLFLLSIKEVTSVGYVHDSNNMSVLFLCEGSWSGLIMNIIITWQHQVKFDNRVTEHKQKTDYQLYRSESLNLRLKTLQRGFQHCIHLIGDIQQKKFEKNSTILHTDHTINELLHYLFLIKKREKRNVRNVKVVFGICSSKI